MAKTGNGRRTRRWRVDVMRAVRAGLAENVSPARVRFDCTHRLRFPDADVPSIRTISNMKREEETDDSGDWTLEDASPADVGPVLASLRELATRSKAAGHPVQRLTQRQGKLCAIYQALGHDPWSAYVAARGYLALLNRGGDVSQEHVDLFRWIAPDTEPPFAEDFGADGITLKEDKE